jgi:hypothetical protein
VLRLRLRRPRLVRRTEGYELLALRLCRRSIELLVPHRRHLLHRPDSLDRRGFFHFDLDGECSFGVVLDVPKTEFHLGRDRTLGLKYGLAGDVEGSRSVGNGGRAGEFVDDEVEVVLVLRLTELINSLSIQRKRA